MSKILTRNDERTMAEMSEMWAWLVETFGKPGSWSHGVWTYGKEPDWTGRDFCSGPFEIEWIEFDNDADATLFLLRWE